MDDQEKTYVAHALFKYGMYWRIFYGFLRVVIGTALLQVVNVPLIDLVYRFMNHEIAEDVSDTVFVTLQAYLQSHPLTITYFFAFYLLFWGTLDVVLSVFLLKHKLWAFPVTLNLIIVFVVYEFFRFMHTHSLMLLTVIIIDIGVYFLIKYEYKKAKLRLIKAF